MPASTNYISIKSWENYQHYSKRNPPWIKLHNSLLDDYEYGCLQDASKLLLITLFMLASMCDNKIPIDLEWIQQKGMLLDNIDLKPLVTAGFIKVNGVDASIPLATCKQDASKVLDSVEKRRDREEDIYSPFEPFWDLWPNKVARKQAEKAWSKLNPSKQLQESIMFGLKKQIREHRIRIDTGVWCPDWPNPATWINGERWKDDIEALAPKIQPGIEGDGTAVEEARKDRESYDPKKAKAKIAELAIGATRKVP